MMAEHCCMVQVFLADQCQLRHFNAAGFEACMTGRRLFLIGPDFNLPVPGSQQNMPDLYLLLNSIISDHACVWAVAACMVCPATSWLVEPVLGCTMDIKQHFVAQHVLTTCMHLQGTA